MTLWNRYDHAFFKSIEETSQHSAEKIVPFVLSILKAQSVVDVGCGEGSWLAQFHRHGIDDLLGLDGDYVPADVMKIPATSLVRCDLGRPFSLEREFDLAICLETGEHLPEARAAGLVADITKLAPQVLFSAAIPFQRGTHHINCQWPDYWQNLFAAHDYVAFDVIRPNLWNESAVAYWYRQNLVLYVRRDKVGENPRLSPPLAVKGPLKRMVHPVLCEEWDGFGFREVIGMLPVAFKKAVGRRLHSGAI